MPRAELVDPVGIRFYANHHADQGGEQHLGEGFHGFLPISQVQDQQKRNDDKGGQAPLALNEVCKQSNQADQDKRMKRGQTAVSPWIMVSRVEAMASNVSAPCWVSYSTKPARYPPRRVYDQSA